MFPLIPARIKYTGNTFYKNNTLRIINFCSDVNTYKKIIFTIKLEVFCNICGSLMIYHACYEVNYKSNEIVTKITILRYMCKSCNVTHSLKPEFLASRHQYDTFERQQYVLQYNEISKEIISLRNLCCKLFPSILVSHTVMYYWVCIITERKIVSEPLITKEINEYKPSCDITYDLLPETEVSSKIIRNKEYSRNLYSIIAWSWIYIRITAPFREKPISDFNTNPFIYINRILDILTAHVFL